jgi:type IV pilus assembly protein PilB
MVPVTKQRARLGDLLISRGVITEEQLAKALEVQRRGGQEKLLGEILVDLGYASQEQVLSAVAEACGVPFARLSGELLDPAVRSALPEAFCRKHGVLPLFRVRDVLTVAVPEPANVFLVDEIAQAAGTNVQIVAATTDNIYQILEQTRGEDRSSSPADELAGSWQVGETLERAGEYEAVYGDWPPEKLADLLLHEAVRAGADAIHLEPDEKVLRVRFRIDGILHVVMRPPARLAAGLTAAFVDLMGLSGRSSAAEPCRSARIVVQGRAAQLHLASIEGAYGPRTVARIIREEEAARPLEKLGCEFKLLDRYRELVAGLRGLFVVAGPRASGVTTTLYSALGDLDPVRLNVCTFEACIGFHLTGLSQFSPATCGMAERSEAFARLLLQEPDVLMLDGVMDERVAAMAVEAALDERLVLAQIKALDASDAVARLADWVSGDALASVLRGVLAQRLVRTICPHCKAPYDVPAALRRSLAETVGSIEGFSKGRGCAACRHTGFLGRIGLFELLPMEPDIANLVRQGADAERLREAARQAGHPSLWMDGLNKTRAGITSLEEVMDALTGCPGREKAVEPVPNRTHA